MLDYDANASQNWPLETIIAKFEDYCESHEKAPDEILFEFLGDVVSPEEFWQLVASDSDVKSNI